MQSLEESSINIHVEGAYVNDVKASENPPENLPPMFEISQGISDDEEEEIVEQKEK